MDQHPHSWQVCPHGVDMLRTEHRMHAAVSLPENHPALLKCGGIVTTQPRLMGVPDAHLFQRHTHRSGSVAAEVLIGKEEHPLGLGKGPLQHSPGIT